ncbi:MAG: endonuclease domain-containing protein [Clostridia bacterium]|nr:endonuclease domain-containing protein [Clostridia bacterium]
MPIYYNGKNKVLAQVLRRNLTKQESHLWYDFLSKHPVRFRRQKQFGRYIVDFYCAGAKLVIEIDGNQHYTEDGIEIDRERSAYLEGLGLRVIRFHNADIDYDFRNVCKKINVLVNERTA